MNIRKGQVIRPATLTARDRGGGANTIALVTRAIGAKHFMSGVTTFEPGAAIPRHFHNCDEVVYLVEGRAIAEIDGHDHLLSAGDATFIPEAVPHCFRNASQADRMTIYWTYASLDATRTIVATGMTTRIEDELGLGATQPAELRAT